MRGHRRRKRPTDDTVRPATAPAKRSNGRLILGIVVLLALVGALGLRFLAALQPARRSDGDGGPAPRFRPVGPDRGDTRQRGRSGRRHGRERPRPSRRPISMPGPAATSPSAPSISAAGSRPETCWWRSRRRRSITRSRRPRARSRSFGRACSRRRPIAIWRR